MLVKVFEFMKEKSCEFSVNLDYEDLNNKKLCHTIIDKIEQYNFKNRIIFEIVESEFIDDFTIVEDFAKEVRRLGGKIAIDDFGSGFSSMENILKLKPEIIKIDGTLIKNIDTSNDSRVIVRNIIAMSKELGSSSVAEYIHNKKVCDICRELGVDFLQGFYLGEPSEFIKGKPQ